jgi:hypothetical protein
MFHQNQITMKTYRVFILLCIIALLTGNVVQAQPPVVKYDVIMNMNGQRICTEDYLWGDVVVENMLMSHNWVAKVRKAMVPGYLDAGGTILSGNVYELSQTVPGLPWIENTGTIKLDGKNIGNFKYSYYITTNANGEVTVENERLYYICH